MRRFGLIVFESHRLSLHRFFGWIFAFSLWPVAPLPLQGYDAPNLDYRLVDRDALLISQNERETLVELLAAVAGNFPDSDLVDDDLREKALALALQINPLSINARNTHRALKAGKRPNRTGYFSDSVSSVAERLWKAGAQLGEGEPEAAKLALFVQELALVLHPEPPLERVRFFWRTSSKEPRDWGKAVTQQPLENPSFKKLRNLIELAGRTGADPGGRSPSLRPSSADSDPVFFRRPGMKGKGKSRVKGPKGSSSSMPQEMNPGSSPAGQPRGPVSEIRLTEVEIPFVAYTAGSIRKGNLAGKTSLQVRSADSPDFPPGAASRKMALAIDTEGFRMEGLDKAARWIGREFPNWPTGKVAVVRFNTELSVPAPRRRMARAENSLSGALLLYSVFSGKKPFEQFVFAGSFGDQSSQGPQGFSLIGPIGEVIEQAKEIKAEFLVIPDRHFEKIVEGAISSRHLSYLFDPQLISFKDWEDLKSIAFGEDQDALRKASEAFREIQAVQDKMTLAELAKNEKVQERLDDIIKTYPHHLSARVMLAFGQAPDDPKALIREAIREVDGALAPFFSLVANSAELERSPSESASKEAIGKTEHAEVVLAKLGTSIEGEAKDYVHKGEDFLEAAEKYLRLTNKESSGGRQRLEEWKNAFLEMQTVRATLGIDPIRIQDYR